MSAFLKAELLGRDVMYFFGRRLGVNSHSVEVERECQEAGKESCEGTVRKGQSGGSYRQDILEIQVINFKEFSS
jgi:hypothetical protein